MIPRMTTMHTNKSKNTELQFWRSAQSKGAATRGAQRTALTQLHVLVVGHDEDDVGPDVPAVPLDAAPKPLGSGGGEGRAAGGPVQRQEGRAAQEPLEEHGGGGAGGGSAWG